MTDQRGQLLRAALGSAGLAMPAYARALHGLHARLDSAETAMTCHMV